MNDIVMVALISGLPALVSTILTFINNILLRNNTRYTKETQATVNEVAKQTNGLQDALLIATTKAAKAEGNLEGRAELKEERRRSVEELGDSIK